LGELVDLFLWFLFLPRFCSLPDESKEEVGCRVIYAASKKKNQSEIGFSEIFP